MSPYYDMNLTPMVMLVDLMTMEIIYLPKFMMKIRLTH